VADPSLSVVGSRILLFSQKVPKDTMVVTLYDEANNIIGTQVMSNDFDVQMLNSDPYNASRTDIASAGYKEYYLDKSSQPALLMVKAKLHDKCQSSDTGLTKDFSEEERLSVLE